jgi:hypothetical protein
MADLDITGNDDGSWSVVIDYDGTDATPTVNLLFTQVGDRVTIYHNGEQTSAEYDLTERFEGELNENTVRRFLISGGA